MAAGRSLKSLLSRRRRPGEEGEDEDGPVVADGSQSEESALSDIDDQGSDVTSVGGDSALAARPSSTALARDGAVANGNANAKKARAVGKKSARKSKEPVSTPPQAPLGFTAAADTEAMMNGLTIDDPPTAQEPALEFEDTGRETVIVSSDACTTTTAMKAAKTESAAERQRSEHEEYQRKRDSNPAFVPNRGTFFMHDTRSRTNGQDMPMARGGWQGRGRGRGAPAVGGPFSPANQLARTERAAQQSWKHDLHEAINDGGPQPQPHAPFKNSGLAAATQTQPSRSSHDAGQRLSQTPRAVSFSSTKLLGTIQMRVLLAGMKAPISFADIPWKHYTRLPDHRPPLRRDKPVRVYLPEHAARYIFPSTDRSFIFIPRQMRPNQQAFRRGYQRSTAGGPGFSSRRTSMYGGSMYSGSFAPSRRSSIVGPSRENAFSPVGSFTGMPPTGRPVVRLPYGGHHPASGSISSGHISGHHTPSGLPQQHMYSLPQQPTFQGTPTTTVHQPQPQKAISVTGIESPAMMQTQNSQSTEPFQNQLADLIQDAPVYSHPQGPPPPYFSPQGPYTYPQQSQNGTPLSGIPEQAIHAPSFQPAMHPAQAHYAPMYPPTQAPFYYPAPGMNGYPPPMPMYMAPTAFIIPPPPPIPLPPTIPAGPTGHSAAQSSQEQQPPPLPPAPPQQPQSGMVAHESNGMVFYMPASEAQQSDHYHPAERFVPAYAMPGLAPPTPAPDARMGYYYPPPMQPMQAMESVPGIEEVATGVYYPASS